MKSRNEIITTNQQCRILVCNKHCVVCIFIKVSSI